MPRYFDRPCLHHYLLDPVHFFQQTCHAIQQFYALSTITSERVKVIVAEAIALNRGLDLTTEPTARAIAAQGYAVASFAYNQVLEQTNDNLPTTTEIFSPLYVPAQASAIFGAVFYAGYLFMEQLSVMGNNISAFLNQHTSSMDAYHALIYDINKLKDPIVDSLDSAKITSIECLHYTLSQNGTYAPQCTDISPEAHVRIDRILNEKANECLVNFRNACGSASAQEWACRELSVLRNYVANILQKYCSNQLNKHANEFIKNLVEHKGIYKPHETLSDSDIPRGQHSFIGVLTPEALPASAVLHDMKCFAIENPNDILNLCYTKTICETSIGNVGFYTLYPYGMCPDGWAPDCPVAVGQDSGSYSSLVWCNTTSLETSL